MRGSIAWRRAAKASASCGVDFSIGVIFSTPLSSVTSDNNPPFALVDDRQTLVEEGAATRDEALEIRIDRDRQGAALQQFPLRLMRDQALFEGAISAASHHPHITP